MWNIVSYNTRITPTSCTLLDLFVTTRRDLISESGVYPLEISHHNLVYVTMKLKNKRPPLKCIRMRDYKRLDQDKFQSDIESAPFHIGSIFDNADTRLWVWQKLYFNICDEHAPWKQVIVSNKSVPWIANDIRYIRYEMKDLNYIKQQSWQRALHQDRNTKRLGMKLLLLWRMLKCPFFQTRL